MEKPLYVRVAEALGAYVRWNEPRPPCVSCGRLGTNGWWEEVGWGSGENYNPNFGGEEVTRYDTDWSATGPLIERFAIDLSWHPDPEWLAVAWCPIKEGNPQSTVEAKGATALLAACNLILALHAAGKLPKP